MSRHNGTIAAAAALLALIVALALAALPISAQTAGSDEFTQCVEAGAGETACLAQLGRQLDWRPTEAACRYLAVKTEAIIEAGGDVRYRDLFYNERCARLGLPHGRTAAAAGDAVDLEHPYLQCMRKLFSAECDEELGRHSSPPWEGGCHTSLNRLREDREKKKGRSNWYALFDNERCWRANLPHFEF